MTLTEETRIELMRLCDGELAGEQARAVSARCREDARAAAYVAALEADRALLRAAFPAEESGHAARAALEAALAARRRQRGAAVRWRAVLPIAASIAIAVVAGAGGVFLAERRAADVAVAAVAAAQAKDRALMASAFGEALDRQVSGSAVDWRNPDTGSSGAVMPLRTFRAADGRWCREFEERVEQGGAVERRVGIACRDAGRWRLELERPAEA